MATNPDLEVRILGKDELSPELQKLESRLIRFVGSISAALAGIKLLASPIKAASDFERELANVAKTTDFVSKAVSGGVGDLDRLSDSLLRMSLTTNVAATDLAKIAAAAGQQGLGRYGVEGITQFTESISRMASVLDIAAEEAANQMGKIVNIFKVPLAQVENAVSVINEVSNKSTASGEELLDVIKRIGDAAGSLDLSQATALAATALDFGTSPEVAGTAFARMFSSATEKAEEFGDLMGDSATGWVKRLKTDGLGAFKDFLARLRQLDESSQQKAIVKLVGGGRIGALLNKLVQDTTNTVLERNFQAAQEGESGTSALREQAKVLGTLSAQATILHNSFIKLGIESSQQLLQPLAQYAAQLSAALQTPEFKAFFDDVFTGVGKTLGVIVDVAKAVANLGVEYDELGNKIKGTGVNWTNFSTIIQAFIGLKVAQAIQAIVKSLPGMAGGLKSVNAEFAAMALAGKGGGLAKLFGFEEAFVKIKKFREELKATKALAATATSATAQTGPTQRRAISASGFAVAANQRLGAAGADVGAARAAVQRAEAAAAAGTLASQAALNTRIQQAEAKSNATKLQIKEAYQGRLEIIEATGTKVGLTALNKERDRQFALEEASHARSLRSIEGHYAKRATAQAAALNAEVLRARAAMAQQEAILATATTQSAAANATATAARAAADTAAKTAAAAAAAVGPKLTLFERGIAGIGVALAGAGVALRTFASVAVSTGRLILGGLSWITLIYTIADAFGLLEGLGPLIQEVTDFFGFTSAAARAAEIDRRKTIEDLKNEQAEVEKNTETYKKYFDAKTGKFDTTKVKKLIEDAATTPDAELQQKKFDEVGDIAKGAQADKQDAATKNGRIAQAMSEQANIVEKGEQEKLRIEKHYKELRDKQLFITDDRDKELTASRAAALRTQNDLIAEAKKKIDAYSISLTESKKRAEDATEALKAVGVASASAFTEQTRKLAQDYIVPIKELELQIEATKKKHKELGEEASAKGKFKEFSEGAGLELFAQMDALEARRKSIRKELDDIIKDLSKQPGISPTALKSFESLRLLLSGVAKDVLASITALGLVPTEMLTATDVPGGRPAASGIEVWDPKKQTSAIDASNRALRKAERDKDDEELDAELALVRERSRIRLEEEQREFDLGLLSLKDFHESRQDEEQKNIQAELDILERKKKRNKDTVAEVKATPLDPDNLLTSSVNKDLELIKLEKERVELNGKIAVLMERQPEALKAAKAVEEADAKNFREKVGSETLRLKTEQIIPTDTKDLFQSSLDEMLAAHDVFIRKLEASENPAEQALAKALKASFNVEAFKRSINPIKTAIDELYSSLQRQQERIGIARDTGVLTSVDAEIAYSDLIKAQIPLLETKAALIKKEIEIKEENKTLTGDALAKEKAGYEELILGIRRLGAETDKIAKDMNKSLSDNIEDAFDKLTQYGSSLKDVVKGFIYDMAGIVKKAIFNNALEGFLNKQGAGAGQAGGFGGFMQSLLGGKKGTKTGPTGAKNDEFHVIVANPANAPAVPGAASTAALPLDTPIPVAPQEEVVVRSLDHAQADDAAQQLVASQEAAATATDSASTGLTNLAGSISTAGISVDLMAAATGNFAPLLNRITGSILDKGIGSLVSAAAPAATSAVSGGAGGLAVTTAGTTAAAAIGTAGATVGGALGTVAATVSGVLIPLQAALTALTSAIAAAAARAAASGAVGVVGTVAGVNKHSGGVIGGYSPSAARWLSPALFAGAPRYHGGGVAGLSPDEVPSVLLKGEEVLTKNQQSLVAAAMDSGKNQAQAPVNIRNVLVSDPSFVTDVVGSSQGEKVLMSFITKNRMGIRQAIGT